MVNKYPHVTISKCPNGDLLATISFGKGMSVSVVGDRITCSPDRKANCYCMYLKDKNIGWWETLESEMERL